MAVEYDRTALKVLMVSPTAWTATPPLRWFDNYCIIALEAEPALVEKMRTYHIRDYVEADEPDPKTVKAIYGAPAFERLVRDKNLIDYRHILNRAHAGLESYSLLTNDYELTQKYENKAWFRRAFSDKVLMPRYQIVALDGIEADRTYADLAIDLSAELVVQHPSLAGSRGTYFVSSVEDFNEVIVALRADKEHSSTEIVVSERIQDVTERSLQVCVTKSEILIGPPQAQLVRHPLLTYDKPGSIQFCGGRIGHDLMPDSVYSKAREYAMQIGDRLRREGYRGVFGIDFLISDEVYVLEVNPRFTGLSPLLASLQHEAPYMLLHILEHSNQSYRLHGHDTEMGEGSFITVYAQRDGAFDLDTGLYDGQLNKIGDGFENAQLLPDSQENYFIATRIKRGEPVKAGKSLVFIYSRTILFDQWGELTPGATELVARIRERFHTEEE